MFTFSLLSVSIHISIILRFSINVKRGKVRALEIASTEETELENSSPHLTEKCTTGKLSAETYLI